MYLEGFTRTSLCTGVRLQRAAIVFTFTRGIDRIRLLPSALGGRLNNIQIHS